MKKIFKSKIDKLFNRIQSFHQVKRASAKRTSSTSRPFFGTRSSRQGGTARDNRIDVIYEASDEAIAFETTSSSGGDFTTDDTSGSSRPTNRSNSLLSERLNERIDQTMVRLGSYWSSAKQQLGNYCDDFKRKLLDNLQNL